MTPPKYSTATLDTAANFFQRGKKPSTAQRVVTAKKGTVAPITLESKGGAAKRGNYQENGNEEEEEEEEDIDDAEYSDERRTSVYSDQEEEEHEDEHEPTDDEIQSNDSDAVPAADLRKKIEKATPHKESIVTARKAEATKAKTARKKTAKTTYVAPYVGDIYAGFHQAGLSDTEKQLRQFDLASKYGPCTELTRLERWERAFALGLNPPQDVKETIVAQMALNTPVFEGRV